MLTSKAQNQHVLAVSLIKWNQFVNPQPRHFVTLERALATSVSAPTDVHAADAPGTSAAVMEQEEVSGVHTN